MLCIPLSASSIMSKVCRFHDNILRRRKCFYLGLQRCKFVLQTGVNSCTVQEFMWEVPSYGEEGTFFNCRTARWQLAYMTLYESVYLFRCPVIWNAVTYPHFRFDLVGFQYLMLNSPHLCEEGWGLKNIYCVVC